MPNMNKKTFPGQPLFTELERETLLKIFPKGIIAFDLETTGLSPTFDHIVEISALKITQEEEETFSTLVHPPIEIPEKVIAIHGITNSMVKDAPERAEVLKSFSDFIDGKALLAHNALFDIGFLAQNYSELNLPFTSNDVYCSVKLSRKTFSSFPSHKLSFLVKKLGIPLENHHRAFDDAVACLKVFIKGLTQMEEDDLNNKTKTSFIKESYQLNFKDFAQKSFSGLSTHHNTLKKSLRDGNLIQIKYNGGSQKNKFRPIRPISVIPRPQGLSLYAHCLQTDHFKFYLLKKIPEIKKLKREEEEDWKRKLEEKKTEKEKKVK